MDENELFNKTNFSEAIQVRLTKVQHHRLKALVLLRNNVDSVSHAARIAVIQYIKKELGDEDD